MPHQPNKTKISCIILAGGKGNRFNNKDKGLILLDKKPLIEHILERIRPQVDDIIISANRNTDIYKNYSTKVIPDKEQDYSGPLTGIAACIPECEHDWILVIPCDIPSLPVNLVERLIDNDDNLLIVAKAYEQRQLVFLMHRSLEDKLNTFLDQGHQRVMTWLDIQNPKVVDFETQGNEFLNINTPDELTALKDEPDKD